MTPDDLDRIEERLAKADPNSDWYTANEWYAARATLADKDVPALIAEVRRLAADLLVQQSQAHDLMSQIEGEAWAALAEWRDRAEKAEAALDRVRLDSAEKMCLTIAVAQVRRGDPVMENIAAACVIALARITGNEIDTPTPYRIDGGAS